MFSEGFFVAARLKWERYLSSLKGCRQEGKFTKESHCKERKRRCTCASGKNWLSREPGYNSPLPNLAYITLKAAQGRDWELATLGMLPRWETPCFRRQAGQRRFKLRWLRCQGLRHGPARLWTKGTRMRTPACGRSDARRSPEILLQQWLLWMSWMAFRYSPQIAQT